MTFTSILLSTHFFPSPTLVLNLLELFHLLNQKPLVTFSPISTSVLSFSFPGCLPLDLAKLSNPQELQLTSSIFPYPAEPTRKQILNQFNHFFCSYMQAAKHSWENDTITQAGGTNSFKITQITRLPNLSNNPFVLLEVVPLSISHIGYLPPASSSSSSPFPVSFLVSDFLLLLLLPQTSPSLPSPLPLPPILRFLKTIHSDFREQALFYFQTFTLLLATSSQVSQPRVNFQQQIYQLLGPCLFLFLFVLYPMLFPGLTF